MNPNNNKFTVYTVFTQKMLPIICFESFDKTRKKQHNAHLDKQILFKIHMYSRK